MVKEDGSKNSSQDDKKGCDETVAYSSAYDNWTTLIFSKFIWIKVKKDFKIKTVLPG